MYLSKFTTDGAKEAVTLVDSEEAYIEAKKILSSRFGDRFLVSNAYQKKISEWPRILPKDGPGLRRFSDFRQHCYTAMHSVSTWKYSTIQRKTKNFSENFRTT